MCFQSFPRVGMCYISTSYCHDNTAKEISGLITQGFILTLTGQQADCNLTNGDGV